MLGGDDIACEFGPFSQMKKLHDPRSTAVQFVFSRWGDSLRRDERSMILTFHSGLVSEMPWPPAPVCLCWDESCPPPSPTSIPGPAGVPEKGGLAQALRAGSLDAALAERCQGIRSLWKGKKEGEDAAAPEVVLHAAGDPSL